REDCAPFGWIEIGPALHEVGRTEGEIGAVIHVADQGLDHGEQLRLRCQEARQALLDKPFEFAGRNPTATGRLAPGASDESRRDVVAIARALLVGMGRRHPRTRVVVDQPCEQADLVSTGTGGTLEPVGREPALYLVPEGFIYDRLMLAGIAVVLVDDFATVEAVLQHEIERATSQRLAS